MSEACCEGAAPSFGRAFLSRRVKLRPSQDLTMVKKAVDSLEASLRSSHHLKGSGDVVKVRL